MRKLLNLKVVKQRINREQEMYQRSLYFYFCIMAEQQKSSSNTGESSEYKYMGVSAHIDSLGVPFVETAIILENGRTFSHNNHRSHNGLVFCPKDLDNKEPLILPAAESETIIFINNIQSVFYHPQKYDELPQAIKINEGDETKFISVTDLDFKGVRSNQLVPIIIRNSIDEESACSYCIKHKYEAKNCAFWLASKLRLFVKTNQIIK